MAFPQGINFRATAGYVTDGTNEDHELTASNSYPWTTAQGNTVGFETVSSNYNPRDRNSGNDRRIAGNSDCSSANPYDFRFDLPSAGTYNIRVAIGDGSYAKTSQQVAVIDTTTSLGNLFSGVNTGASNSFADATGSVYTAANWPGSNTAASKTFSTTIFRLRLGNGTNGTTIAHAYVESGATSTPVFYNHLRTQGIA